MIDFKSIKKFICIYKTLNPVFLDEDDRYHTSWIDLDSPSEINYWLYGKDCVDVIPGKKALCFDVTSSKEENFTYPVAICGVHVFKDPLPLDEEDAEDIEIKEWGIANNKEEFDAFIKEAEIARVPYIFELKDDIYEEATKYAKKVAEEFENHLMRTIHMKGDIVITDPCYIIPNSIKDYDYYNLEELGFSDYLCHSTLYGDWSCHVFNTDTKEAIGQFCADAGMFGVFYRDEIKRIYPDFEKEYGDYCYTIIENFEGDVYFEMKDPDTIIVKGTGNINFASSQTGL